MTGAEHPCTDQTSSAFRTRDTNVPHHGAVEGGGSARQHRLMQNETPQTTTAAAFGRSSIARLPPTLREAVDAAIADGATIDEITARIRAEGGACSALGRRPLRQEHARPDPPTAGGRPRQRGVGACARRAYRGQAGLILIETLRTLVLSTLADLSRREEPVSTAELARLALVLKRIEGTDKLRLERERAAAKAARAAPGAGQAQARRRSGRASRPRPWPPSARSSRAGPGGLRAPSHRRRSTRGILRTPTYPS